MTPVILTLLCELIRNDGVQNTMGVQFTIQEGGGEGGKFSIRGFKIPQGFNLPYWGGVQFFNKGVQNTMDEN